LSRIRYFGITVVATYAGGILLTGGAAPSAEGVRAQGNAAAPVGQFAPRPLSRFAAAKAERLLRDRLSCLGCHKLDGAGGEIGPDLSQVGRRRSPRFILGMISDPQGTAPGSLMPLTPMPPAQRELVASYLVYRGGPSGGTPVPPPAPRSRGAMDTPLLYARYCAACHGKTGGGDGPNASLLPVRPTVHTDRAYMSTRPDDSLFDAIFAGGYVMNRSNRMPGFGHTLTAVEIRGLVRYLRELCRCEGPAWSRDGGEGEGR
jgi:mono/diheme cytochrome c family protein